MTIAKFQQTIWDYHRANRRDFPWRNTTIPYRIVVSEIMLQQTQAPRVIAKYQLFIKQFPNWKKLAEAPFKEVLLAWQGLGYNRRAKSLQELAKIVIKDYNSKLPTDPKILETLPGIGKATANSICAFAFNKPVVFIETNIRSVFIYFFFPNQNNVHDNKLLPLIEKTLDQINPREWYFALMDYGVKLKKEHNNPSRRSKHHQTQTKFEGSHRQIRGLILKILGENLQPLTTVQIAKKINKPQAKTTKATTELVQEGYLVSALGGKFHIRD